MAEEFYGDETKAAELGGVEPDEITEARIDIINGVIDSEIRTLGFNKLEAIEYYDIKECGKTELMLKKYPVINNSVTITNDVNNNPTDFETTDFIVDNETGIIQLLTKGLSFSKGVKNVKVVYEHGFDSVPSIISKLATLLMAKLLKVKSQNMDADGLKSFTAGNYSESKDLAFMNVKSEFDDDINSFLKKGKIVYYLK
jgi:hypothetical protein